MEEKIDERNLKQEDIQSKKTNDQDNNDLRLFAVIVVIIVISISITFLIWGFGSENNDETNDYVPYGIYKFKSINELYSLEYQWGNSIYDINFRYHPDNVSDIPINGPWIDLSSDVYIAFDPYMSEKSLANTRAATLDLIQKLSSVFGRTVQVVCTNNSHPDCQELPAVTCETHESAIIFYESEEPRITLKGSCYEIHGFEEDIFRAEHKLAFVMLNIIRE